MRARRLQVNAREALAHERRRQLRPRPRIAREALEHGALVVPVARVVLVREALRMDAAEEQRLRHEDERRLEARPEPEVVVLADAEGRVEAAEPAEEVRP